MSELPSFELRPGVAFPDGAAVTSPTAADALVAILTAFDPAKNWSGYDDAIRATRDQSEDDQ